MATDVLPTAAPATTNDIMSVLRSHHTPADQWAYFEELRIGTGYGKGQEQRLDAWAMHLWPSHRFSRWTFEVKVSRSDFLREIRDPMKRRPGLLYSNLFYFVTPAGLVKPAEIPPECGLIEVQANDDPLSGGWWGKSSNRLWVASIVVPAPWRDATAPTWSFFASLARRLPPGGRLALSEVVHRG